MEIVEDQQDRAPQPVCGLEDGRGQIGHRRRLVGPGCLGEGREGGGADVFRGAVQGHRHRGPESHGIVVLLVQGQPGLTKGRRRAGIAPRGAEAGEEFGGQGGLAEASGGGDEDYGRR